jgi:alkylated DNA repair dioxygenase AlkB
VIAHQRSLFAAGVPAVDPDATWERIRLDDTSWVDVARGWLAGADTLLDQLVAAVPWSCGRRWMYDRMVDDPRLSHRSHDATVPHPALAVARAALADRYGVTLGPLALNYYRDGRDSVAFHRDRELRRVDDTLIAIVTLGARRPFLVRPLAGAHRRAHDLAPASGDVLVMGGACQMAWEHAVPKTRHALGPRVSATWRWAAQELAGTRMPAKRSDSYSPSRGASTLDCASV